MTVDFIDMEPRAYIPGKTEMLFSIRDGTTAFQFTAYPDDVQFIFSKNIDMFENMMKDEIMKRAGLFWDDSMISDADYETFKKILELIL